MRTSAWPGLLSSGARVFAGPIFVQFEDLANHLHLLHWDKDRALLYINSSDLGSSSRKSCGSRLR